MQTVDVPPSSCRQMLENVLIVPQVPANGTLLVLGPGTRECCTRVHAHVCHDTCYSGERCNCILDAVVAENFVRWVAPHDGGSILLVDALG